MDPSKSQIDFYVDLLEHLIVCDPLSANTSKHLRKDVETMKSRVLHEGLSFLTKSLPRLGKALDHGLENSRFSIPVGFSHSHGNRSIPAFMQEYFNLVFDAEGILREDASAGAIKHLRQCLFLCYKLESPYSRETEERVISSFVSTDEELRLLDLSSLDFTLESMITQDVFGDFDHLDIVPRHGPGAVATGERGEDKWDFSRKYSSIHSVYPYYDYFVAGGAVEILDRLDWYKSLIQTESGCAKVVLVPKDSRGPRLISCEPLEYQWIQQGLGRKVMSHLESNKLTGGFINFTRQEINGHLALSSSVSREFATLDLKDASDRVSLALVRQVFSKTPRLLRALEATRTTHTKLPDGTIVPLNKFAPMGSALCFPIEAYCFWVVIVSALARNGIPLRRGTRSVYVYGDDIIVPTEWADLSIRALEDVGLLVNTSKSCIHGFFRESCGVDAFKGVIVTPLRVRKPWTRSSTDGTALSSYVSLMNSFCRERYERAASFLLHHIEEVYGVLPRVLPQSGVLGLEVQSLSSVHGFNRRRFKSRWNPNTQQLEYRCLSVHGRSLDSKLEGWTRMLRNFVAPPTENPSKVYVFRSTTLRKKWRVMA